MAFDAIDAVLRKTPIRIFETAQPGLPRSARPCAGRTTKGRLNERSEHNLDLGLESRSPAFRNLKGKFDRPPQSHLVDRRRAHRVLGLADLEHRCDQAAAGGLPLFDR